MNEKSFSDVCASLIKNAKGHKKILIVESLWFAAVSLYALKTRAFYPNSAMRAAGLLCVIPTAACVFAYFFDNKYTQLSSLEKQVISIAFDASNISKSEIELLSKFCTDALGNEELNKRLENILATDSDFISTYKPTIELLYKFTSKTKDYKSLNSVVDKLDKLINSNSSKDSEKITHAELGRIYKFLGMSDIIAGLNNIKSNTELSDEIKDFIELYTKAEGLYSKFGELLANQISYKDGDIILYVANRCWHYREHLGLRKQVLYSVIKSFYPYSHAAISVIKEKPYISHIIDIYRQDPLDTKRILGTRTFRISPHNLMTDDVKIKVCQGLDIDAGQLENELSTMYQRTAKGLHLNESISWEGVLKNDAKRLLFTVPADFIFGRSRSPESIREWATPNLLYPDVMGSFFVPKGFITCSAFVARMTVLTLLTLEKELLDKIQAKYPDFTIPEGGLLKMPFHEYEDLSRVDPVHLINELKKVGAVEKIHKAEIMKNVVKTR